MNIHRSTRTLAGQSVLEYAVVLIVVVAALLGMQRYMKAHLMGRWRATADTFGGGQQYESAQSAAAFGAASVTTVGN